MFLQLFNGGSLLGKINGVEFLHIRKSNDEDGGHGGHGVKTWTMDNIMKIINEYLNGDEEN